MRLEDIACTGSWEIRPDLEERKRILTITVSPGLTLQIGTRPLLGGKLFFLMVTHVTSDYQHCSGLSVTDFGAEAGSQHESVVHTFWKPLVSYRRLVLFDRISGAFAAAYRGVLQPMASVN